MSALFFIHKLLAFSAGTDIPDCTKRTDHQKKAGFRNSRLPLQGIAKIAISGTFHDGLGAVQSQTVVDGACQCKVPIAGQKETQIRGTHFAVELRISTPGDVEVKGFGAPAKHFDLQGSALAEGGQDGGHDLHRAAFGVFPFIFIAAI